MLDDEVKDFLRRAHIGRRVRIEFEEGVILRNGREYEGYIVGLTQYRIGLGTNPFNETPDKEIPFYSIANYNFRDVNAEVVRQS